MKNLKVGRLACFILFAFLMPMASWGQDANVLIQLSTAEVVLNATVKYKKNNTIVTDLKKEQFKITVDNNHKPENIVYFSEERIPASWYFVLDASSSMQQMFDRAKETIRSFRVFPEDQIGVLVFRTETVRDDMGKDHMHNFFADSQFMNNPEGIFDYIKDMDTSGMTPFYEALQRSITAVSLGKFSKKVLVILSDGQDSACPRRKLDEALESLKHSDILVYAIAFVVPGKKEQDFSYSERDSLKNLQDIAELTGGRTFRSDKYEVEEAINAIQEETRHQYVLAFSPSGEREVRGKEHKLKLSIEMPKGSSEITVRTREKYKS